MKNILKIFLTDSGRILSNVVAMVVIMGLCVLPSLYAWFNIFSNWDPYGQESTSNLQIAVYSEDSGDKIAGEDVNIGTNVLEGLKANKTIGWVFVDSKAGAIEGVHSGKYYAALVIPENFTKDMISFMGGTVAHPASVNVTRRGAHMNKDFILQFLCSMSQETIDLKAAIRLC